jgi:hypothetical protein
MGPGGGGEAPSPSAAATAASLSSAGAAAVAALTTRGELGPAGAVDVDATPLGTRLACTSAFQPLLLKTATWMRQSARSEARAQLAAWELADVEVGETSEALMALAHAYEDDDD